MTRRPTQPPLSPSMDRKHNMSPIPNPHTHSHSQGKNLHSPASPEPLSMDILQRITFGLLHRRASLDAGGEYPGSHSNSHSLAHTPISGPSPLEPSPRPPITRGNSTNTFGGRKQSTASGASNGGHSGHRVYASLKRFRHRTSTSNSISHSHSTMASEDMSNVTEAQAEVLAYNSRVPATAAATASTTSGGAEPNTPTAGSSTNNKINTASHDKFNNYTINSKVGEVSTPLATASGYSNSYFPPVGPVTGSPAPLSAMPAHRSRTPVGQTQPQGAAASPAASPYPLSAESMRRQRSFLRSITNHASISALRNRTWKRKDIPSTMSLDGDLDEDEAASSAHGHAYSADEHGRFFATLKSRKNRQHSASSSSANLPHYTSLTATSTRPRLRRSLKRTKSSPSLETIPVPPVPTPPLIIPQAESTHGHGEDRAATFVRRALHLGTADLLHHRHRMSVKPNIPSHAHTMSAPSPSPILPPLPPSTPLMRRETNNKVPVEVGLEFGATPSPQSDRILRRTPELDSSIRTHRRYKSDSASQSASSSVHGSLALRTPKALPPLPVSLSSSSSSTSRAPSGGGQTGATETSFASVGSFDITVLDRLLESDEVLTPTYSTHSRMSKTATASTADSENPTKHTRHDDASARSVPSTARSSATPSYHSAPSAHSDTSSRRSPRHHAPPSITIPPSRYHRTIEADVNSAIESDLGDVDSLTDVIPFTVDASHSFGSGHGLGPWGPGFDQSPPTATTAGPIGLGLIDMDVGASHEDDDTSEYCNSRATRAVNTHRRLLDDEYVPQMLGTEEPREIGTPFEYESLHSGVSSPLETDLNTPMDEVRPGSVLDVEHERKWAAFANMPDSEEDVPDNEDSETKSGTISGTNASPEGDFQPVLSYEDEHLLSFQAMETSFTYTDHRSSFASSEESFGAPHPHNWQGGSSLSTIAEVSYSSNALSLSSMHPAIESRSGPTLNALGTTLEILASPPPLASADWFHARATAERSTATDMLVMLDTELGLSKEENLSLRKRLRELEFSLEQARSALMQNEDSVDALQASHETLERECENLRASVSSATREKESLSTAIRDVKEKHAVDIASLRAIQAALTERGGQLTERTQELAVARLESNTKDAEIEQLRYELEMVKFATQEARVMLGNVRKAHEVTKADLSEAVAEQENAWKTAGFFKEELEAQAAAIADERALWNTWILEREEYEKRFSMLRKQLEISDRKLNIEEGRAYRAEEFVIPRLEERIESLTILLREATENSDGGDANASTLSVESNITVNTVIDQETDLITLRRAVDAKEIELADVTYQYERHKRACSRDMTDLREDVTSLKDEVKTLKLDLSSVRESEEMHRGRAADYFQRNKTCLMELDRLNLIATQRKADLDHLRTKASNASITEAALEKRITHLEDGCAALEQALQSKEFELSMLKRQMTASPTPQRSGFMKRSLSRAAHTHTQSLTHSSNAAAGGLAHSASFSFSPITKPLPTTPTARTSPGAAALHSRLKDRGVSITERESDSPSPTSRKLRLKRVRAVTSPSSDPGVPQRPSKAFPDEVEANKALTPTSKHNAIASEIPDALVAAPNPAVGTPTKLGGMMNSMKKRTQSTPHGANPPVPRRPVSVLLGRTKSALPVPKPNRKQ